MAAKPGSPGVIALSSEIGRGHPNYLDSLLRAAAAAGLAIERCDVFRVSRGLSRLAWRLVRLIYRIGAQGGLAGRLYGRLRRRAAPYDPQAVFVRLLARHLVRRFTGYRGICLVDHPLVARILAPVCRVHYLHGEHAVPVESVVPDASRIYVPTRQTAAAMRARGVPSRALTITGILLEPELEKNRAHAIAARRRRMAGTGVLTVGFAISGAYPAPHAAWMLAAARACLAAGMRVRCFWGTRLRKARRFAKGLGGTDVLLDGQDGAAEENAPAIVVHRPTREAETLRSLAYLPALDVLVAAAHERVNWALGAGLPMFLVGPPIGGYAVENRALCLAAGVAKAMDDPVDGGRFTEMLATLRADGTLERMAASGNQASGGAHETCRRLSLLLKGTSNRLLKKAFSTPGVSTNRRSNPC